MPILAGLLYALLAWATMLLTSYGAKVAAMWPANAVILAMLLTQPRKQWRSLLIAGIVGNSLANLVARGTIVTPVFFGMASMVEVLVAAIALRGTDGGLWVVRNAKGVGRFLLWAGCIAPAVGAVLGALTTWLGFGYGLLPTFIRWFSSDALGLLIFTPFFCAVLRGHYVRCLLDSTALRRAEGISIYALNAVMAFWAYYIAAYPVLFTLMIPLMLATFRRGILGATTSITIVTVVGSVATLSGSGPIAAIESDPTVRVYLLQVVAAVYYAIVMPIAAVLEARTDLIARLRDSEQSLRLLASQSPVLILSFDLDGICQRVVGTAENLLDRDPAQLAGKTFHDISEEGQFQLRRAHDRALDDIDHSHAAEFRAFRVNDKWLEAVFKANFDADGRCIGTLATLHDVTERKMQELSLSLSAKTDSLTGLLNRAGFRERLDQVLAKAEQGSVSLAMIDVDRFKHVNDQLGHQAGDLVLKEIARRISSEMRAGDAVGRLGGDEFIILLAMSDWRKAQDICDRVVNGVGARPIELPSGETLAAAISCGVTRYRTGLGADAFIHEADVALYEAKRGGRNRVVAA